MKTTEDMIVDDKKGIILKHKINPWLYESMKILCFLFLDMNRDMTLRMLME